MPEKLSLPLLLLSVLLVSFPDNSTAAEPAPEPVRETGAASDSLLIDANTLNSRLDRKLNAIGDAVIQDSQRSISGDTIQYDLLNDQLHVEGNAVVKQKDIDTTGPEMKIKLEEYRGYLNQPIFKLKRNPLSFSSGESIPQNTKTEATVSRGVAEKVVFDGSGRIQLFGVQYTTCEEGNDDWYLRARQLDINTDAEMGYAKHPSLFFKDVPIFYAPSMRVPYARQRMTGFLTPHYGTSSKGGLELSVPYYWNISPNKDATLTSRYMSLRGLQLSSEFRYLTTDYNGITQLQWLPNDQQAKRDRSHLFIKHNHTFDEQWSGNLIFQQVSDNKYFSDLSTLITNTSQVNLPQQAFVKYNGEDWKLSGLVQRYQTLDNASYPYQRLPELNFSTSQTFHETGQASLSGQWVNFSKNTKAPRSIEGNRFTVKPSLSFPMTASYGYFTPKLGMQATSYTLSNTDVLVAGSNNRSAKNINQAVPILSLDGGLYFDRDMSIAKTSYTQTLEPRLFYVYIPYRDQSSIPVFDTGEVDLNLNTMFTENRFVGNDRVGDANQVSIAATSRLLDNKTGAERLVTTLGQRFYFSNRKVTLPGATTNTTHASDIVLNAATSLVQDVTLTANWQYDNQKNRLIKSNVGARYTPEPGKVLNLTYRYTRDSLRQIDISTQWPLYQNWHGVARVNYSLLNNQMVESLAGVEYDGGCWQFRMVTHRLKTATASANYTFFIQLQLNGLGSLGSNPANLLSRSVSGYTPQ